MKTAVRGRRTVAAGKRFDNAKQTAEVARLYAQGKPQSEIGRMLGVSQPRISQILAGMRAAYEAAAIDDILKGKARALATLDKLETELWASYSKSCAPKNTKRQQQTMIRNSEGAMAPTPNSEVVMAVQTEDRAEGNSRILGEIRKCVETRARILGLMKIEPAPPPTFLSQVETADAKTPDGPKRMLVIHVAARPPAQTIEAR